MFNLFKKKCPICGMELKEGKDYPEGFGKKLGDFIIYSLSKGRILEFMRF